MRANCRRVLFIATVVKSHIMTFHVPYLKMLKEMGYETGVAAKNDYENPDDCKIPYCDRYVDIPFQRNPFCFGNVRCYQQLKALIDEGEFDMIHCHTPVGGVLGRLAARKARKKGTRVVYTAHGFHFYRGAPLLNWLLYYPVEKICSYFADAIITINKEDSDFANRHFKNTNVFFLPGIGVDVAKYSEECAPDAELGTSFGIGEDDRIILSVGELIDRKNHKTVIKSLNCSGMENVHYFIAGDGVRKKQLEAYAAESNVADRVHFLGFRCDIAALLRAADVFVFPSYQEGLPVALLEAMASGVPVVASSIRGNVDLIQDGVNGFLCHPEDAEGFAQRIRTLLNDPELAEEFRRNCRKTIKNYDLEIVVRQLREIYCRFGIC